MARPRKPSAPALKPLETKIACAIATYESDFPEWDQAVNAYLYNFKIHHFDIEQLWQHESTVDLANVLCKLISIFIEIDRFHDTWTTPRYTGNALGLEASIESQKFELEFRIGIDLSEGFYLTTALIDSAVLSRMHDDFWWLYAGLAEFGELRHQVTECPMANLDKEILRNIEHSRSGVFGLIANYILFQIEDNSLGPHLGDIEVCWPKSIEWPELIRCGFESFRRLHRMNYLIYRMNYISQKAAEKSYKDSDRGL